MSTEQPGALATEAAHEGTHPPERQYIVVALVLGVLTALEVGLYYVRNLNHDALIGMLGVLAVAKFSLVVLYFMHLKFDSRIFRGLFVTGLVMAVVLYVVVLAAFHVWSGPPKVLLNP
ncbi:MAG: cytochrome C oxidase subunit IV [Acidimicrobiia bacterium]